MNKAYNKITWQNKPSTATPLNQTNLNEMSNALDTIDDRVIALDSGKVSSVAVTNTLQTGDTIATITVDGTATNIKSAQVEVDAEPSATSENPLQNKAIYEMLNNLLPEETVQGNPIAISDASGLNAKACSVDLLPIQDLSQGDPSPTNICPITGRDSVTLTVNGEDTEITLPQTVYGGTLDVTNGKLTIDSLIAILNGTEGWTKYQSTNRYYADGLSFRGLLDINRTDSISNEFSFGGYITSMAGASTEGKYYLQNNVGRVAINSDTFSTASELETYLSTNNMQVVFPLATPIEITLTAEQISLLKGNNVVSTDGDNIKLVYSADIKSWVESQLQS